MSGSHGRPDARSQAGEIAPWAGPLPNRHGIGRRNQDEGTPMAARLAEYAPQGSLYALVAAGKSVESIRAKLFGNLELSSKKGRIKCSFTRRKLQIQAGTKLMKHSYIGHRKTIPQSSKPPPRALLGKQLQQQVE